MILIKEPISKGKVLYIKTIIGSKMIYKRYSDHIDFVPWKNKSKCAALNPDLLDKVIVIMMLKQITWSISNSEHISEHVNLSFPSQKQMNNISADQMRQKYFLMAQYFL